MKTCETCKWCVPKEHYGLYGVCEMICHDNSTKAHLADTGDDYYGSALNGSTRDHPNWGKGCFEFVRRPSEEACPGCGAGLYNTCKDDCPEWAPEPPVIEQKPVCACCTQNAFGCSQLYLSDDQEPIRHDDPCVYASSERWMKPAEKAMFREQMERRKEELDRQTLRVIQLEKLARVERYVADGMLRSEQATYMRLTGYPPTPAQS